MPAVRVGVIDGDEVRLPSVTPTPSIRRYLTRNPLIQDIGVETEVIGEQARDEELRANTISSARGDGPRLGWMLQQPAGPLGGRFDRRDEEATDAILQLEGNASGHSANHRRHLPEGLGDGQRKPLP